MTSLFVWATLRSGMTQEGSHRRNQPNRHHTKRVVFALQNRFTITGGPPSEGGSRETILTGRVAIVTGSTEGIGRAIAMALAQNGAKVVTNARGVAPSQEVVREIREEGGEAVYKRADIAAYGEVKSMVDRVVERWGKVDILVVNGAAGATYTPRLFQETDPEDIPRYFARTFGRFYCARAVVDVMVRQKIGKIIFLGTDAGRWPTPSESLNGAAGAALIFATRCLAMELARYGVRVYTISTTLTLDMPGYEGYMRRLAEGSQETVVRAFRKIKERAPLGMNRPEDIAQLALFLASDESNQVSGATVSINGGICFPG